MTPATRQLDALGTAYRTVAYDHDPSVASYGSEAAEALGVDAESVFKTLVVTVDGAMAVACVPMSASVDLKALARAAGAKKAALADAALAERSTGYVLGGISPFGQRKPLPTYIDEICEALDEIHVSGGRRGLEIVVAPSDLVDALDATVAPIAT